jgi:hypothetical protein
MRPAIELCEVDCVADWIRLAIPQPTEWQRIGDEIKAASILTRFNAESGAEKVLYEVEASNRGLEA